MTTHDGCRRTAGRCRAWGGGRMILYAASIIACAVTTWVIIRDEIKRGRTR